MKSARGASSLDDYFAIEEMSEVRHEFVGVEIFAMSGGSRNHNEIALNLRSILHAVLRGRGCRTFLFDVRLKAPVSTPIRTSWSSVAKRS